MRSVYKSFQLLLYQTRSTDRSIHRETRLAYIRRESQGLAVGHGLFCSLPDQQL
ncbi:hypothetical protein LC1Hm_0585 [Halomicrobium sp. LC1Hm]|nr:hypothetical protein LC1Hm_0585 [Halomicrobium sp. LC1Hm]